MLEAKIDSSSQAGGSKRIAATVKRYPVHTPITSHPQRNQQQTDNSARSRERNSQQPKYARAGHGLARYCVNLLLNFTRISFSGSRSSSAIVRMSVIRRIGKDRFGVHREQVQVRKYG
jgi:hypothetical protein